MQTKNSLIQLLVSGAIFESTPMGSNMNLMIVNELKTKVLVFGSQLKANVHFNGKHIEQVENYKYLGNILTTVQSHKVDIFSNNYDHLSGQSRKAMSSIKKRLKSVGQLPPPTPHPPPGYKSTCSRISCVPSYPTAVTSGV